MKEYYLVIPVILNPPTSTWLPHSQEQLMNHLLSFLLPNPMIYRLLSLLEEEVDYEHLLLPTIKDTK